jgi:hypothetical protein
MKYVAAAILATLTTPCMAQDFPPLHSRWRDPQHPGSCLGLPEQGSIPYRPRQRLRLRKRVDDQSFFRDRK